MVKVGLRGIALGTLVLLFAARGIAAEDGSDVSEEAKRAFEQGLDLLRAEKWAQAEIAFRHSFDLVQRPSTLYDLAFVVYMQGRPRECMTLLEGMSRIPEPNDPKYQDYAAALMRRARSDLSAIRLLVTPPDAAVRIDGEVPSGSGAARSLEVLPGRHEAEISARGYATKKVELETRAGTELEREIALDPLSKPALPEAERAPAHGSGLLTATPWIIAGTGGALLVAGVVTGIVAKNADDEFQRKCPTDRNCDPSLASTKDRASSFARATDVLLISGGALAVGGLTFHFVAPDFGKSKSGQTAMVTLSGWL